jgi:hypothetical protein
MFAGDNLKPQLFVVAQKDKYLKGESDSYISKYKAVCDHLFKTIERDGKLDLHLKRTKSREEFNGALNSLRNEIDQSRPYAFLFLAPEHQGREQREELENTFREISDLSCDDRDVKPISSSVIVINDQDANHSIDFQDHLREFKKIANEDGDLFERIANLWDKFTLFSVNAEQSKLNKQVEAYAEELSQNLLKAKIKVPKPLVKELILRKKSQACKKSDLTIRNLKPEQREKIHAVDWVKAAKISTDKSRSSRYPTMKLVQDGLSYGEVAEKIGKKPGTVEKTVRDFLLYTGDFLKGVDLETVTISK